MSNDYSHLIEQYYDAVVLLTPVREAYSSSTNSPGEPEPRRFGWGFIVDSVVPDPAEDPPDQWYVWLLTLKSVIDLMATELDVQPEQVYTDIELAVPGDDGWDKIKLAEGICESIYQSVSNSDRSDMKSPSTRESIDNILIYQNRATDIVALKIPLAGKFDVSIAPPFDDVTPRVKQVFLIEPQIHYGILGPGTTVRPCPIYKNNRIVRPQEFAPHKFQLLQGMPIFTLNSESSDVVLSGIVKSNPTNATIESVQISDLSPLGIVTGRLSSEVHRFRIIRLMTLINLPPHVYSTASTILQKQKKVFLHDINKKFLPSGLLRYFKLPFPATLLSFYRKHGPEASPDKSLLLDPEVRQLLNCWTYCEEQDIADVHDKIKKEIGFEKLEIAKGLFAAEIPDAPDNPRNDWGVIRQEILHFFGRRGFALPEDYTYKSDNPLIWNFLDDHHPNPIVRLFSSSRNTANILQSTVRSHYTMTQPFDRGPRLRVIAFPPGHGQDYHWWYASQQLRRDGSCYNIKWSTAYSVLSTQVPENPNTIHLTRDLSTTVTQLLEKVRSSPQDQPTFFLVYVDMTRAQADNNYREIDPESNIREALGELDRNIDVLRVSALFFCKSDHMEMFKTYVSPRRSVAYEQVEPFASPEKYIDMLSYFLLQHYRNPLEDNLLEKMCDSVCAQSENLKTLINTAATFGKITSPKDLLHYFYKLLIVHCRDYGSYRPLQRELIQRELRLLEEWANGTGAAAATS